MTQRDVTAQLFRPRCYVCNRFVAMEAYDVFYDNYSGGWEEGYTACPDHGGPSRDDIARMRREQMTYEAWLLGAVA